MKSFSPLNLFFIFWITCYSIAVHAQQESTPPTSVIANTGDLGRWSAWAVFNYDSTITMRYRTCLLKAKKGCTILVDLQNQGKQLISGKVLFKYELADAMIPKSKLVNFKVKPGATIKVSYNADACKPNSKDYDGFYAYKHSIGILPDRK